MTDPYREKRPWGNFEKFTENEVSTVKIITVNPGEAFSLQHHAKRDEFWRILSGRGLITIGEESKSIKEGDEYFIKRGTNHRVEASEEAVVFLEIAFGEFDEQDITRVEDKYGRN
jgi:mannose-6-phosphate isomerase-like protein (cupin superfamily)